MSKLPLTERHPENATERRAYALAGNWCGGERNAHEVRALQLAGGNGPLPEWASSDHRPRRPATKRPARAPRARAPFKLDDITREEPPSMRRHVTERPAAA